MMLEEKDVPEFDQWGSDHFKKTLLSKSHITNGGKVGSFTTTLSTNELSQVEQSFREWLLQYGYPLP